MKQDDYPPGPTLKARQLSRSFGDGETRTVAVNDAALDLHPGQLALLMGPSGSGKSTLLAILSGLLSPDSGQVLTLGEDLWAMSEKEREHFRLKHFGFIFQGYNLFSALTARQQLEMVVRWGEGAKRRARRGSGPTRCWNCWVLPKKASLRPAELSGGEKQAAWPLAACWRSSRKPNFCFADEPTSALDWHTGEHVIEQLRNAGRDRGATVLVVAHDARIIPFADRVFYMEDGCLRETEDEAQARELVLRHHTRVPQDSALAGQH